MNSNEKNIQISNCIFESGPLYAIPIDAIYPIKLITRVREKRNEIATGKYQKRKEFKDFILTIDSKKHFSKLSDDFIVGRLVKTEDNAFFKPEYSDILILLASDSKLTDNSSAIHIASFDSSYEFLKVMHSSDIYDHVFQKLYYPENYGQMEKIRNLVLSHPLCIEIDTLKRLDSFQDNGIWEIMINEALKDDYEKKLLKMTFSAQRELLNAYLEGYEYYEILNSKEKKHLRKQLIKKLF